ncbi:MAG: thermonuclease family protein [Rhodothermales bacterium]
MYPMLLCFLIICLGCQPALAQTSKVSIVVDGDRMVLSDGRKVSLLGVDAPEKHPSAKLSRDALSGGIDEAHVIQQGKVAGDYLNHLVGGMPVILTAESTKDTDGYVRAIVYLVDAVGRPQYSINQRMIEKGYAVVDYADDFAELAAYRVLEKNARQAKRGLWARGSILVKPQEVETNKSSVINVTGSCARDTACVWVSGGGGVQSGVGMWQSRPGRKCACAKN